MRMNNNGMDMRYFRDKAHICCDANFLPNIKSKHLADLFNQYLAYDYLEIYSVNIFDDIVISLKAVMSEFIHSRKSLKSAQCD